MSTASQIWSMTAAPAPQAVRDIRNFVRKRVTALGCEPFAESAALAVSELATNAVLHARTPFTVTVTALHAGGVRITVHDDSPVMPTIRNGSPRAATGRGLRLVEWLSDSWGADPVGDASRPGKDVWFTVGVGIRRPPGADAYADHDSDATDSTVTPIPREELIEVRLLNTPLELYAREVARYKDLMREMALVVFSDDEQESDVPAALVALAADLEGYRNLSAATDRLRTAARAHGETSTDLVYQLPPAVGPACARLNELLDHAEVYCITENLLMLSASPSGVALRRWLLGEITAQMAGETPRPWAGPLT